MKKNATTGYFRGAWEELTKVTWLTKNQAVRLTIIVFVSCLAFALFLGAIDFGFGELHSLIISS